MKNKIPKEYLIAVATPVHRDPHINFIESRDALFKADDGHLVELHVNRQSVTTARNAMTDAAIAGGCTHIWFVDADQWGFDIEMLNALVSHDVDIIGPLNFLGGAPYTPVIYKMTTVENNLKDVQPMLNYPRNQLFEVDILGAGCILIKTSVFKVVPYPWFYQRLSLDKRLIGEDYSFCLTAKQKGIKIYCDSSWCVNHESDMPMNEVVWDMFLARRNDQQEKIDTEWAALKSE